MKYSNYIINGILGVAVIVLFILHFTCKGSFNKYSDSEEFLRDSINFHLPIAYVKTDSLMAKYQFSIDLNDEIMKKIEDETLNVKRRQDRLMRNVSEFQQKIQNNAFLSTERAQQEEGRLMKEQEDLQTYAASVERELAYERARMAQQLNDTVIAALKVYNTPKKYEVIFSNAGTDVILFADDLYNITDEVIQFLNDRYVPEKK